MRDSRVKSIFCNSLEFSGTIQIGDSEGVYPFSIARAVQKENPVFYKEYITDDEEIIKEPLPNFLKESPVQVNRENYSPIRINSINSIGLTGSSVLHVGSFKHGKAVSIVRHKRILQKNK
ncbi:spore germination protein GerPE [Filobacillus milosensis]|nr:spore germination protein GerPE [Filobacillus milosensis]